MAVIQLHMVAVAVAVEMRQLVVQEVMEEPEETV
jgi:hypothetical protein